MPIKLGLGSIIYIYYMMMMMMMMRLDLIQTQFLIYLHIAKNRSVYMHISTYSHSLILIIKSPITICQIYREKWQRTNTQELIITCFVQIWPYFVQCDSPEYSPCVVKMLLSLTQKAGCVAIVLYQFRTMNNERGLDFLVTCKLTRG